MAGLSHRLQETLVPIEAIPSALLEKTRPQKKPRPATELTLSMWIRMLFSCLVDADFLDTEAFMSPERIGLRGNYSNLGDLQLKFDKYMQKKVAEADPTSVNRIRAGILEECRLKATEKPTIFSLSVPTGGGKTLSSLAFALRHARKYNKRRIIYVIPYTSIIEQTVDQFRTIFGDNVLEHHSNLESPETETEESLKSRLAAENWDAPIIVTTTVQFFESLFASRTSRCRKLHNIVGSVVIFDEAQLLPPELLKPVLKSIEELQKNYQVTALLSTATQPAFGPQETPDFKFDGLPGIQEIIKDPCALHEQLKRVRVELPEDMQKPLSWEALARELTGHRSVLCIVNRRDDCRKLHSLMPKDTIHLSALMCGAHRSRVIAKIKKRLLNKESTRVISTQLVEAGVDFDFPVVYRALAGLDSIAQAAGRCNREGRLAEGLVKVFIPEGKPLPGYLGRTAEIGRRLLDKRRDDPLAPEGFTEYFRELYWLQGERLDANGILPDLADDPELRFKFRTVARKFQIIDQAQYVSVVVCYDKGAALIKMLKNRGLERWLLRKLQRYMVNIPRYMLPKLLDTGEIEEPFPEIYIQSPLGRYDETLGLCYGTGILEPDSLII